MFHFIRQQYGGLRLHARRDDPAPGAWLAVATIYTVPASLLVLIIAAQLQLICGRWLCTVQLARGAAPDHDPIWSRTGGLCGARAMAVAPHSRLQRAAQLTAGEHRRFVVYGHRVVQRRPRL